MAIVYLKKKIEDCRNDTELSPITKQLMVSEFTKAINVLEYERYNFVPTKTSAEQLNKLTEWKELWDTGYTKFVPELLGFTKAVILDNAFAQSAIDAIEDLAVEEPERTITYKTDEGDISTSWPDGVGVEAEDIHEYNRGEDGSVEVVIDVRTTEEVDEVKIEGRAVEEPVIEGRKKGFFSWFK